MYTALNSNLVVPQIKLISGKNKLFKTQFFQGLNSLKWFCLVTWFVVLWVCCWWLFDIPATAEIRRRSIWDKRLRQSRQGPLLREVERRPCSSPDHVRRPENNNNANESAKIKTSPFIWTKSKRITPACEELRTSGNLEVSWTHRAISINVTVE